MLYISDNEALLRAMGQASQGLNCSSTTFRTGMSADSQVFAIAREAACQIRKTQSMHASLPVAVLVDGHMGSLAKSRCMGIDLALILRVSTDVPVMAWSFLDRQQLAQQGAEELKYGGHDCYLEAPFRVSDVIRIALKAIQCRDHPSLLAERGKAGDRERLNRLEIACSVIQEFGHKTAKRGCSKDDALAGYSSLKTELMKIGVKPGLYLIPWLHSVTYGYDSSPIVGYDRPAGQQIECIAKVSSKLVEAYHSLQSPMTCSQKLDSALRDMKQYRERNGRFAPLYLQLKPLAEDIMSGLNILTAELHDRTHSVDRRKKLDAVMDLLIYVDSDWRATYVNP